jgi:hypothetical protein
MTGQRLLFEHRLDLGAQTVKATAHVRYPAAIQIRVPAGSEITGEDS